MGRKKNYSNKEFDTSWDNLFHRIYRLRKPIEDDFVSNEEEIFSTLTLEKTDLNSVKASLNSVDIVLWRKHTANTHKFSYIPHTLRNYNKTELTTQAWAKFYSILSTFNLVKVVPNDKVFASVHLCEAPGAFVTSLNHFIRSNCGGFNFKWEWTGTTLNPYYEGNDLGHMIPDDRFLIETFGHWDFGTDFTGNVMSIDNLNHLKEKFLNTDIHLVTADGSIDCSDDPGEQESVVAMLFLWEVITALNILSDGGSFVLKIFTVFERFTISLLYLLNQLFNNVTLFKPGPSKPGNSEVYVISEGFCKHLSLNSKLFESFQEAAFKGDAESFNNIVDFSKVPKNFLESVIEYVEDSCSLQKEAIKNNIRTFEKLSEEEEQHLKQMKIYFANKFIKELGIHTIDDYVSPMFVMKCTQGLAKNNKLCMNYKTGSFNQRKSTIKSEQDKNNKVLEPTKHKVVPIEAHWYDGSVDISKLQDLIDNFQFIKGKKFVNVKSSNYCSPILIFKYFESNKATASKFAECFTELMKYLPEKFFSLTIFAEANDLEQMYSEYFVEQNISSNFITVSSTHCCKEQVQIVRLCILQSLLSNKIASIKTLIITLSNLQPLQTLLLQFQDIVLTNFWCGIFYLLSKQFKNSLYFAPGVLTGNVFMVYEECKSNDIESFVQYLNRILQELVSLHDGVDILHVVPLYSLMQSDFRDYIKSCNEYFIQRY